MDNEHLTEAESEILSQIPIEFHSTLCTMAYDRGHNGGVEEYLGILRGLVVDLSGPIEEYSFRLIQDMHNNSAKRHYF
jgi:hypothetical protein